MTLHAYIMFDMNVIGLLQRSVSTTYTTIVGKLTARESAKFREEEEKQNMNS